jgi:hypothetical protein
MVSGVQGNSLLQTVRAEQAFKNAAKQPADIKVDFASDGVDGIPIETNESNSTISQNPVESQGQEQVNTEFKSSLLDYKKDVVNDFKDFIGKIGKFNVNNEDIDYALRYGKSILVDQKA